MGMHTTFAPPDQTAQVKKIADRPAEDIRLQQLTAFIQPRIEEFAEILGERLRASGRFEKASTGIVCVEVRLHYRVSRKFLRVYCSIRVGY